MIRLSELLNRRELGLRLATGCEDPRGVQIAAAEVCELLDPRPWLEPGAMLLTTGVGLGHGAHGQRLLVERAVQGGASAVGFGVGLAHAELPAGVVGACERLELPLVSVPPGTPFRLLVSAVGDRAAPYRLQAAQRTLAIQSYLMEALSAPEPEAELLRRLGSLLSGTALIAGESGEIDGAPNAALPDELWGPLRGGKGVGLHHLRGRRYVTAQVGDRPGARRWIVVVGESSALPDQLARQALQSAERLARLVDRARPPRPAEARAVRNEVAEELLGLRPMNDRRVLARRAALLGLGVDSALQVAVLRVGANGAPREARFQHAARILGLVEERLTAGDVPFVLTHREDDVLVVAPQPLDETLRAPLHELSEASVLVHTGVGRAVPTLDSLPRSLLDARFAVEQLRVDPAHHDRAERILSHADLDLATALVCDADPAVAEPRRAALLDRVIANELRETLLAYLDHQLDISRTAAYLHLHPNSLRYRLGRIEEQLGRSLRDPGTIANLHLAVILERATRRADNGDT